MGKSIWTPNHHTFVVSPNCCYKIGSAQLSRKALYAVVLQLTFTGTKRPKHFLA